MPNGSSLTQIQQEMIKSAADALGLFHAQYIFTTGVFVGSSTAGTRVQKDVQFEQGGVRQRAITDEIKVDERYTPVKLPPKELLLCWLRNRARGGTNGSLATTDRDRLSEMLWVEQ
ncbi:hypothetical protein PRIC1_007138 [Phytophthora ramorum]